ncbi:MAG: hypothetical protein KME15_25765 [Drouetiella hepatica Uher 2000/2452]|uniref:Uncharacterized protein n=1 Tax=Drouetiella hepatica Uher 2000/2452 TaxID=904376 RepID=A0A951QHC1_9CYAN|nr:hypothetical protein [Drouetiella hepatica Uher 2000/2452]
MNVGLGDYSYIRESARQKTTIPSRLEHDCVRRDRFSDFGHTAERRSLLGQLPFNCLSVSQNA